MISNTFYLIVSKLIPALLLTFINIIFSRKLSLEDYGIYQTIWSITNVSVIIVTFGIPRYIMSFGNYKQYGERVFIKIIAIAFIVTLIPITIYLFMEADYINSIDILLLIIIISLQGLYLVQESNIISSLKNKALLIANVIYALFLFISHIFIIYSFNYSITSCLIAIVFVSALRNIILLFLQNRTIIENAVKKNIDKIELLWFGLNDTLQILTKWFDKLVLIVILSSTDYAIYFNGTYEIPLIGMALSAFQSVVTSYGAKANDEESQIKLFKQSTSVMACILFPLFALCFCFSREIITTLFTETYERSISLFMISVLLLPLRIASYTVLLQLKKKGKIILLGSLLDFCVAISLMIFLYPHFGLEGLIFSMVIATYFQAAFYVYYICKSYGVKIVDFFDFKQLFFMLLLSLGAFLTLKYFILDLEIYLKFIFVLILFAILILFFLNKKIKLKELLNGKY